MTTIYILARDGTRLYQRDDALEFLHYVEDFASEGQFPLSGGGIECGQILAWQDDDGLWQAHEVVRCETDAYGDYINFDGRHIARAALSDCLLDSVDMSGEGLRNAAATLLNDTGWAVGTLPDGGGDTLEQYKTTTGLNMRSGAGMGYKVIATYSQGSILTRLDSTTYSGDWYKMRGADNRTGYMWKDYLTRVGDTSGDGASVTVKEENPVTVWSALQAAAESAGVYIAPRVEMDDGGITGRYIDFEDMEPAFHGVRLSCNMNVRSGGVTIDETALYTALKGMGKNDITFTDKAYTEPYAKPKGQSWVEDETATATYGRNGRKRLGIARFSDVDNVDELFKKTCEQLKISAAPKVTIELTIADLYALGYGGESLRLHDMVQVTLEPIALRMEAYVSGLTRDLVEPEMTRPVIGTLDDLDVVKQVSAIQQASNNVSDYQIKYINGEKITSGTIDYDALSEAATAAATAAALDAIESIVAAQLASKAAAVSVTATGANSVVTPYATGDLMRGLVVKTDGVDVSNVIRVIAGGQTHTYSYSTAGAGTLDAAAKTFTMNKVLWTVTEGQVISVGTTGNGVPYAMANSPYGNMPAWTAGTVNENVCDSYDVAIASGTGIKTGMLRHVNNTASFYFTDTRFTSLTVAKGLLAGVKVLLVLNDAAEYAVECDTVPVIDTNGVQADGEITVTYNVDTKAYIDGLVSDS